MQMPTLGYPVRIKYVPLLAFCPGRYRPASDRPSKRPSKNWPRALEKRHPKLQEKRARALDWNRHDKTSHEKIVR